MGDGQLEVLDLVPVMGVGLGHHGLLPLLVDVGVAGRAAELRRLVVVVLARPERGVAGLGRLGGGQAEEDDDGENENDGHRGSSHGASSPGVSLVRAYSTKIPAVNVR